MAETAKYSIVTRYRRINLAKVTSGAVSAIPKITHIALGTGGVDSNGNVIVPDETQEALAQELVQVEVKAPEFPVDTTARYTITLGKEELVGEAISEMGLIDAQGKLCAVRNTLPKIKDSDEEFTFLFDDEF